MSFNVNQVFGTQVFGEEVSQNTFKKILATLNHVTPHFISRREFEEKQGDYLVQTGSNNHGDTYDLFIPEDLNYGESLGFIDTLTTKFNLQDYGKIEELITQTKVIIGILLRTENIDSKQEPQELAEKYNLDHELIEKLSTPLEKGGIFSYSAAKNIMTNIQEKNGKKKHDKLSQEDLRTGSQLLKNIYGKEFDLTFFRKGINSLRLGMMTMTQAEQEIVDDTKENIYLQVDGAQLDKQERLLRDKIGVDNLLEKLKDARKNNDKNYICQLELEAVNSIIQVLHEYPYQKTNKKYGYQVNKILQHKEIYCVGFALLAHAFLSELDISHNAVTIPKHIATEVVIGHQSYYLDPVGNNKVYKMHYGKSVGAYKEIILSDMDEEYPDSFIGKSYDIESALFSSIYNNVGGTLKSLGTYEQAIEMFDQAINFNPYNSGAYKAKGEALSQIDEYQHAIHSLGKAIELHPNNDMAHYQIGTNLMEVGNFQDAIEAFGKAITINPNNWLHYAKSSHALYITQNISSAINHCKKAISLNPIESTNYYSLAIFLKAKGRQKVSQVSQLVYDLLENNDTSTYQDLDEEKNDILLLIEHRPNWLLQYLMEYE